MRMQIIDWLMTDHGYTRGRATETVTKHAAYLRMVQAGGWTARELADRVAAKERPAVVRDNAF